MAEEFKRSENSFHVPFCKKRTIAACNE